MIRDKDKIQEAQKLIAKKLMKHRKACGYASHEKFSGLNDVSRSSYESYEQGGNMNLSTFIHIVAAMGLSFSEFFEELDGLTCDLYPDRHTKEQLQKIWPPKG